MIVAYLTDDKHKADYVHRHITDHLQDAREAAEYEAKAPYFTGTLPFREVA